MARPRTRVSIDKPAGVSVLMLASLLVAATVAGGVVWLALHAEETRQRRDGRRPQVVLPMPFEGVSGPVSSEPLPEAEMAEADGDDHAGPAEAQGAHGALEHGSPAEGHAAADAGHGALQGTEEGAEPPHGEGHGEEGMAEPRPPGALPEAPDPDLIEETEAGPLPVVAPDGRRAWRVYARPFENPEQMPVVAVIVFGLGMRKEPTDAAIEALPPAVTLGFSPYTRNLDEWLDTARRAGHEVLVDVPTEPVGFPENDPGPDTLLTTVSPEENLSRLERVLARGTGYVGVIDTSGSRFTTYEEALRPVLAELERRGLMFVDSRVVDTSIAPQLAADLDLPRVHADVRLDRRLTPAAVDSALQEAAAAAREHGLAVIATRPVPLVLERLAAWLPQAVEDGLRLAPVSATANKQGLIQ